MAQADRNIQVIRRLTAPLDRVPQLAPATRWLKLFGRTIRGAVHDDFGIAASSIAFAAFLAMIPLVGLIAGAFSLFASPDSVTRNLMTLAAILPAQARRIVIGGLHNTLASHPADPIALLGALGVALFSARRAGRSLLHGINLAYRIDRERRGLRRQIASTLLVLGCAALVLTALISLSVLAFLKSYVPDGLPGARIVSTVVLFGSLTLGAGGALLLIYRYAPAAETPIAWRRVVPGTIAAVAMWLVATTLFRAYVSQVARFDDTYGSLSAVIVLMLWLLVSAWALLLGARLNAEATAGD